MLILITVHTEYENTQSRSDDKQNYGSSTSNAVVRLVNLCTGTELFINEYRNGTQVCVDFTCTCVIQIRNIEHLQTTDHGSDQGINNHRSQQRQGHLAEHLTTGSTVNCSSSPRAMIRMRLACIMEPMPMVSAWVGTSSMVLKKRLLS